jgi:hypothetical protein
MGVHGFAGDFEPPLAAQSLKAAPTSCSRCSLISKIEVAVVKRREGA